MRAMIALPLLLLAVPAAAAETPPWEHAFLEADPGEILAAVRALPPPEEGAAWELLFEEGIVRYDERGHHDYTHRLVYRVFTDEAAMALASVGTNWSPWREKRPGVRARVITADGVAHLLDPATVGESGSGPTKGDIYSDGRSLRGPLPAIAAGAVVEEETVRHDVAPIFSSGDNGSFTFRGLPSRKVRLRLEAPTSLPLRFAIRGIETTPRETREGDRRIVVFEAGPLERAARLPDDVPPRLDAARQVMWSTGKSWADVAEAYYRIAEEQLAGAGPAVAELAAGLDRRAGLDAVVATLLERIEARVRYTGLNFGNAAVVPRRPEQTLARRYGDCKDLSTVLVAALRSLGIEARLVLVSTRDLPPDPSLPGPAVFDHAIVAIPGTPPRYIDPTDPASRGHFLPQKVQGRFALVADPSTKAPVTLPPWRAEDNTFHIDLSIHLPERGNARVVEETEYGGVRALQVRATRAKWTNEDVERHQAAWGRLLEAREPLTVTVDPGVAGEPIRLRAETSASRLGFVDDEAAIVSVQNLETIVLLPMAVLGDEPRTHDLSMVPSMAEQESRVYPPPGFTLRELPADTQVSVGPVTLRRSFERLPDEAVAVRVRIETGDTYVLPAADAEALRVAVAEFVRGSRLRFERTAAILLAAGKVREALDEERRLAALHPGEALHRLDLADMLLELGLVDAAKAAAKRAIELEPNSALAHRLAGWIALHDRLGRRYGPGWDREGALVAFRRAKELDPENRWLSGLLGDVLAKGADGEWYGAGSDPVAAAAEFRHGGDALEGGVRANELHALLHAGRFAELLEVAPDLPKAPARDPLRIAATAVTAGVDAAVEQASALGASAGERRSLLESAASSVRAIRRYDLAADLYDRIAEGASHAHELRSRATNLRRYRRIEERAMETADPAAMVDRLLAAISGPALESGARELLADALAEEFPGLDVAGVTGIRPSSPDRERRRIWADHWSSMLDRTVEGDDRAGYRVRLQSPVGPEVVFVVRERDAYRLLAWSPTPAPLGKQALACLDRDDLPCARRWLAWAADVPRPRSDALDWRAAARRVVERGEVATTDELRRAASTLAACGNLAPRFDKALELRPSATDPEEARALDQTLIFAAVRQRRIGDGLAIAGRLAMLPGVAASRRAPATPEELRAAVAALRPAVERSGNFDLVEKVAYLAAEAGDFDTAEALYLSLVEAGHTAPLALNNLAWNALFRPRIDEASLAKAIERARQATARSGNEDGAALHTLATLLAEAGQVREAIDALRASVGLEQQPPGPDDLYVLARLSEHLGLPDHALELYREIAAVPTKETTGVPVLARRRLAALAEAEGP